MTSMYDDIVRFINEYVIAYSEYGRFAENHNVMDKYYTLELSFDDSVTNRDQWYETCLIHHDIQDKLTIEHPFIDEKQDEKGALLNTFIFKDQQGSSSWN